MPTIDEIRNQLSTIKYPGFSRDIVSFGLVKDIQVTGTEVVVQLTVSTADPAIPAQIKASCEAALQALPGVSRAIVRIDIHAPAQPMGAQTMPQTSIPGVRHVIAVGGSYGTLAEMAFALRLGRRVVALDGAPAVEGALRAATPAEAVALALRDLG